MSIIQFTATGLSGGKKGNLKEVGDGYYEIVLGALNVFNSMGEFYVAEPAITLFRNSSTLMRRIKNGALYAEVNHPKRTADYKTLEEFYHRWIDIDLGNVSAHIRHIELDTEFGRKCPELNAPNAIGIIGHVTPYGEKKSTLEDAIHNPSINVAFSIRALTDNVVVNGRLQRTLLDVYTFDQVYQPGIAPACKWATPSMEAYMEKPINAASIVKLAQQDLNDTLVGEDTKEVARQIVQMFSKKGSTPHPLSLF